MIKLGMFKTGMNEVVKDQTGINQAGLKQAVRYAVATLKVSLSVFLLTQSITLRAEVETTAENEAASTTVESAANESASQKDTVADVKSKNVHNSSVRRTMSPWPERKRAARSTVPPPPPGPYMSTALSEHTVAGPAFKKDSDKPKSESTAQDESLNRFSPDRPWPSNLRPAKRWQPESGYQYHSSQHENPSYMRPMNNRNAAAGMGYPSPQGQQASRDRRAGNYNPGMNNYSGSRQVTGQMRQMSNPRGRSYSNPPGYSPDYRPGSSAPYDKPSNNPQRSMQGKP
jgi:hypothetical protein